MDVWIDSGMAWHCARKSYDEANSDVCLQHYHIKHI